MLDMKVRELEAAARPALASAQRPEPGAFSHYGGGNKDILTKTALG